MAISKDFSVRPKNVIEEDAKRKALLIAEVVQSKHAEEIAIFQVSKLTSLADFFVICTAETEPQLRAISEEVDQVLSKKGNEPLGIEGHRGGVWLLMDYGEVILHIFKAEARAFYSLDRLWGDAPQISLSETDLHPDIEAGGDT